MTSPASSPFALSVLLLPVLLLVLFTVASATADADFDPFTLDSAFNAEGGEVGSDTGGSVSALRRRLGKPQCGETGSGACRNECNNKCGPDDAWNPACCDQCPTPGRCFVDPCASVDCFNGAQCIAGGCVCDDVTCVNGGALGTEGDCSCDCPPGYSGNFCQIADPAPCDSSPCVNGGICSDGGPGSTGYTCSCPNSCQNGGQRNPSDCSCDCTDTGYEGTLCETNIDECETDGGNSVCPGRCQDGVNQYTCLCPGSNPCTNNDGICVDGTNRDYYCQCGVNSCNNCISGDFSFTCPCPDLSDPTYPSCQTGETCVAGTDSNLTCVEASTGLCSSTGAECSAGAVENCSFCNGGLDSGIGPCVPGDITSCPDRLTCVAGADELSSCTSVGENQRSTGECPASFACSGGKNSGESCNPALNDQDCPDRGRKDPGTCVVDETGICAITSVGDCIPGDTAGITCDTINHCIPNPCQNGGTCTDVGDTFDCECPADREGPICEGSNQS